MQFTKGLALNEKYYHEVIGPLLQQFDSRLIYSCGLLGYGSDVLGLDNATSMDHNWGPRLQIFLRKEDLQKKKELDDYLTTNLPPSFMGFPTNYSGESMDSTKRMEPTDGPPINHLIEIYGIDAFIQSIVGKPLDAMLPLDWVSIPDQILLEATSGAVFHDGLAKLQPTREFLGYYPLDVQKLKIASLWECISQEEAFIGRCVENADFIGIKLISTRIVCMLLKICFAIKKQYIPYSKWFSIQFKTLGLQAVEKLATEILQERDPRLIEQKVAELCLEVIALNNKANDLPVIKNTITNYYGRPYQVIMAGQIVSLFINSIKDETLKKLDLASLFIDNKIDGADYTNSRALIQRMVGV